MIAIKGLTLPTGCAKCPYLALIGWKSGRCRAKSRQGRNLPMSYMIGNWKPSWCPLVEIKAGEQE